MEIKKSTLHLLAVILIVVIGGYFLVNNFENSSAEKVVVTEDIQEVVIGMKDYNYYPNTVEVELGKTVRISLDSSVGGCFRDFTIRDFGVRKYLKTPSDYVEFTPTKPGTYTFACSMGMGTGKLIVK
ncbi:MAG TPA: cupredoxin domain-containing protein [Candidatus Nanoarchaeia archaeon]|nr:cupredoxin domain-containing protein [Candidatus Nanoarchaeia archaeon]